MRFFRQRTEQWMGLTFFSLFCLLLMMFLVFPAQAGSSKGLMREAIRHQKSTNVAIVVGVEQYNQSSNGVSPLQFAADDAIHLTTVLSQNRYKVKRLVNQEAGKHQILAAINNAAKLINPQDSTLVFSFSGHGFGSGGRNYLLASGATTANLSASALSLNELIGALRRTKAKRIVVFIDACRNIPGQKSISRGFVQQNGQGVQMLLSTAFGSLSWESPKLKQGVFSHFLVKGLQGAASRGDGIIEFNDLAGYVESNVKQWSYQHLNQVQQPFRRVHGEFFGRFVLAAKHPIREGQVEKPRPQRPKCDTRCRSEREKQKQQRLAQQRLQQQQLIAVRQRQQLAARQQGQRQRQQEQLAQQQAAAQRRKQQQTQQRQPASGGRYVEPQMVFIRGGSFMMGSPAHEKGRYDDETQHRVSVGDFWIGKYEVTFAEWDACVADVANGGCSHRPGDEGWGRDDRPVINVSWNDANQYARWLSSKTGRNYRLPTEAEWEYAARAGSQTAYPWGDSISCQQADYDFTDCNSIGTSPVRSYAANRWGLHDTVGNVLEWTCSVYVGAYNGSEQRCGGSTGFRVLRGGSWFSDPRLVRSANRYRNTPTYRFYNVGFRLSRTP